MKDAESSSVDTTGRGRVARIARTLCESPGYQPDWRHRIAERYVVEVARFGFEDEKIVEICQAEPDKLVQQYVRWHCATPAYDEPTIEYAVACSRDPESSWKLKAMVVANYSAEQIAAQFGTDVPRISTFEKLFFDVRPYLKHRAWLGKVCREHRWLEVAFERGWPAVKEVVLREGLQGPSTMLNVLSMRADAFLLNREAGDVQPNAEDIAMLPRALEISDDATVSSVKYPAPEAQPTHQIDPRFKNLDAGSRERVVAFFARVLDGATRKASHEHVLTSENLAAAAAAGAENSADPAE